MLPIKHLIRAIALIIAVCFAAACGPARQSYDLTGGVDIARQERDHFILPDGFVAPYTVWPAEQSCAILIGLHGFNDYRAAFAWIAPYFAAQGITILAFDQRGFGETKTAGDAFQPQQLVDDTEAVIKAVGRLNPDQPLFVLGESMGAAVAVGLGARSGVFDVISGIILSAPASWGWSEMNFFYRTVLWLSAHIAPNWQLTGKSLGRVASDNRDALIEMGKDPFVIKKTRIGAIYSLVDMMQLALDNASSLKIPVMVLRGTKDEIVPEHSFSAILEQLPAKYTDQRIYEDGWHLLLRDQQRKRVAKDIVRFIERNGAQNCKNF